jgi:hypothetical protein
MKLLILYFISVLLAGDKDALAMLRYVCQRKSVYWLSWLAWASSSTVVLMKSLRDEQVAEGQLLPNIRAGFTGGTAKLTEKRGATFWGFMLRKIKSAVLPDYWFHNLLVAIWATFVARGTPHVIRALIVSSTFSRYLSTTGRIACATSASRIISRNWIRCMCR